MTGMTTRIEHRNPLTHPMSALIAERLSAVRQRIAAAERQAGRPPGSVTLLAVSKTQPADAVRAVAAAGQRHFGENYLQEALAKQEALRDLPNLIWHCIGPLQANKTRQAAGRFDWVHSVDRLRIAERLSEQRPDGLPPLNICLQVNISDEPSKHGASLAELPALAAAVAALPRLRLRGLMAIPAHSEDPSQQRLPFRALRQALEALPVPGLDTLSMGMSADLEAAIAEGATLVRIGAAIFGPRTA